MSEDETGVYRDDDGQIYIDTDPNDDWSGREAAEEGSTDAGFDSGSSSGGGGGGSSRDERTAEDFDPDDYPFARSVDELGEIRREEYGLTRQERRRVERGGSADPEPGGTGYVVYDPEFSGGSGEVVGSGDTEAEAATAAVRDRVSEARNTDGAARFSEGLPFDVTDDEVERQQVRELENREKTLRRREQELQQTIDQLPEADRLNIEGTNLESEFGSSIVSRNELRGYFQDQRQRLQENREQVAEQRENVRFELSQVQRPDRRGTIGPEEDPGEPLTGLVGPQNDPNNFNINQRSSSGPDAQMTGFEQGFSTDNLWTQYGSGTQIQGGVSEELLISDPDLRPTAEDQAFAAFPFTRQGTRYALGAVTDRAGLTENLREEAVEAEAARLRDPNQDLSLTEFSGSPVGLAVTGVAGGAGLQSLRTLSPAASTALETGLVGATGLYVGGEGREITEEIQAGDTEAATETAGLLATDLGVLGGGLRAGARRMRPRIGDTSVSEVDIMLDETGADTLVGTGSAESTTNLEIPRLFSENEIRPLEGEADFIVQQTDEGATAAGSLTQERLLDDAVEEDFFSTSRTRFEDDTQTVTRDRFETEENVLFGATRSPRTEPENVDQVVDVEEGIVRTREGEFETREFDTFTRFDEGTDEILGTTRTVTRRSTRDSGAGGAVGGGRQQGRVVGDETSLEPGQAVSGGTLEEAFSQQVNIDDVTIEPVESASMGGAAAGGREGSVDAIEAFEQQERQLQQEQQQQMAVQNSPMQEFENFTREPVSDRLTREVQETQESTQLETQGFQAQSSGLPRTGFEEPPRGLEQVRDTQTPLTRGTTTAEEAIEQNPLASLTQQSTQFQEQEEPQDLRPMQPGIVGLTRREEPRFRQEQPQVQDVGPIEATAQRPRNIGQQRPPNQPPVFPPSRPPSGTGNAGLPSPDLGGEISSEVFDADPRGPATGEFTPDLTGSLFGGGVTEGPVTGLERRNPNTGEEEEDDLFGNPSLF